MNDYDMDPSLTPCVNSTSQMNHVPPFVDDFPTQQNPSLGCTIAVFDGACASKMGGSTNGGTLKWMLYKGKTWKNLLNWVI